jgi:hypothetical protein
VKKRERGEGKETKSVSDDDVDDEERRLSTSL